MKKLANKWGSLLGINCRVKQFFCALSFLLLGCLQATVLPDSLKVTIGVGGETKTLHLHKRSVRTSDYMVRTWDATNGYTTVTPIPEARTFRGTIDENPNAIVYASINADGILAAKCIDQEWGHGYRWSTTTDVSNQLGTPQSANSMPTQTLGWPKSGSTGIPNIGLKVPTGTSAGGIEYGLLVEAEFAMDIVNATYTSYAGSIENILAHYELEALLYDMIMTRDSLIRVPLTQTVIRTETFYPSNPPGLGDMNSEWKREPLISSRWDMVWASTGWYAWSNNIGKNEVAMSAGAMHHENGHNWGAFHLAYMCDVMGGNKPNHGPMTVEVIRKKRLEKIDEGDLSQALEFEDPIHPHTHVDIVRTNKDSVLDIDVLANDWDSNGDSLTVSSYTTTTESGGTVSLNPNGTLRYTPAAAFVGKDIIVYVVQDDSAKALKARDMVHIEVVNNDLMLHYTYEETAGTSVVDSSGYGLTGDLNGADFSTHSVPSPLGKGIKVYGRQNEDQIENANWSGIITGNGEVMPVALTNDRQASPFEEEYNRHSAYYDPMNGDYSFATWFKFDCYDSAGWNSWGHYIASKWWHMETRVGWDLQAIDGKLTLHWRIFDGGTAIQTLSANYDLVEGEWYHATAVFDQTNNEARIYLNGQVVATKTNAFESHGYIFNGRAPLCLGAFADESGYLDDTRIYSKALTDSEVSSLYAMPGLGQPRFFVDTISDNVQSGKLYLKKLSPELWNGGDSNLAYAGINLPSWVTLTNDGYLLGQPTSTDIGLNSFTIRVTDSDGDYDDVTCEITVSTANKGISLNLNNGTAMPTDATTIAGVAEFGYWENASKNVGNGTTNTSALKDSNGTTTSVIYSFNPASGSTTGSASASGFDTATATYNDTMMSSWTEASGGCTYTLAMFRLIVF